MDKFCLLLKAELVSVATKAPKGSENLSQGEDKIKINFTCYAEDQKQSYTCKLVFVLCWNDIFAYIAPNFIDECKEYNFKSLINKLLSENMDEIKKQLSNKELGKFSHFALKDEDFNLIKVQFKALGLIKLSEKKRGVKESTDYWTLTDYGDHVMTWLLAKRKDI